jgi:outer membrane protein insertion porin family
VHRRFAFLVVAVLAAQGCGRAENSLLLLDQLPQVASITFLGNRAISDGTLKQLMTLREGAWWNPLQEHRFRPAQLTTDLNAILTYYMRNGYLKAQIVDSQVRESKGKVQVVITVDEGPPVLIDRVSILDLHALDPETVLGKLALGPGKPMDPYRLQEDRRLLQNLLADAGYWEAVVDPSVQFFGERALVFYRVREGDPVRLGDLTVTVTGTARLKENVLRRELLVKEGELLRRRQLEKSQIRLLQSGFFADARWDTSGLDTLSRTLDVNFRVRERRLHWWEAGVGLSSEGQLRVSGEWGSRSFLGSGARLAVNSKTNFDLTGRLPTLLDDHRTEIILNLRRLFGTSWEGQPNVFYLHDEEIVANTTADYSQDFLGVGMNARLRFGDLRNQLVFSLEQQWVSNHADSTAQASDIQLSRGDYVQRLLTGWVERDTRNSLFNPTRGSFHDVLLQVSGGALGGQSDFFKGTGGAIRFLGLPAGPAVIGGRLRLGYIWPPAGDPDPNGQEIEAVERVPTQDRLFLGGANTVRGYQQDELNGLDPSPAPGESQAGGGLAELLASLELRAPLVWRLGLVGFLDAGNVWQDPKGIQWADVIPHGEREHVDPEDLRYTYGLGFRFGTPVGPVRFDYAWKWNLPQGDSGRRSGWHVAIGQAF